MRQASLLAGLAAVTGRSGPAAALRQGPGTAHPKGGTSRWSRPPNPKEQRCKRPSLGTSKANLLKLHQLKMVYKKDRRHA